MLLDAGADVNCLDHQNLTPLHQAVIHGNRDAAELLLCYGANVHNAEGITDTMSAAELVDHVPVCQMLFSNTMGESGACTTFMYSPCVLFWQGKFWKRWSELLVG